MKITTSLENIQAFGGLNFISNEFDKLELGKLIDNQLGSRGIFAKFSYADVIKNLWLLAFAGGDCSEDIQSHLKNELKSTIGTNVCSADTLLRVQKELATSTKTIFSKNTIENEINTNTTLNYLNIKFLNKLNVFNSTTLYDLDFDNQFVETEKYDAKKGYKMKHGYFPSVASIGKNTVYFENRNGNSNVKFLQYETLEEIFKLLNQNKINIGRARMDCGSFTKDVIKVVEKNANQFYIRAQKCENLTEEIKNVTNWETVEINFKKVQVASIEYKPFSEDKVYRYVISREANQTGQIDAFQQDNFIYRAIITNDFVTSGLDVILFYNQRGASEKIFDELNNDFLWKNLPFSFLNENTVFMMIMAMCRNFYLAIVENFSKKLDFIEPNFRLKKFIFRFVVVPYKWIKKGGQKTLKLFTDKSYERLV
jgi:hypothetical protein